MDTMKAGGIIRNARLRLGLTQKDLAGKLGVEPKTVSKWECGMGSPDISLMAKVAEVLGIPTDTLLSGEEEKKVSIRTR